MLIKEVDKLGNMHRGVGLARIGSNRPTWDKSGTFFSLNLNVLKNDIKKSQICTFWG